MADGLYTNPSVADADVEISEVEPKTGRNARRLQPGASQDHRADGTVGPVSSAASDAYYEFVLHMAGQPNLHTYRSPSPCRSSDVVHLRPEPVRSRPSCKHVPAAVGDHEPGRAGYFGVGRDKFSLDGKVAPGGFSDGVPAGLDRRLRVFVRHAAAR